MFWFDQGLRYIFNYSPPTSIAQIPINAIFYAWVVGVSLMFLVYHLAKGGKIHDPQVLRIMGGALVGVFIFALLVQTCIQMLQWKEDYHNYAHEHNERRSLVWDEDNHFCDFLSQILPEQSKYVYVTGSHMSYVPYRMYPRGFAINALRKFNCVVVFKVQNPDTYVPWNFVIKRFYGDQSLVACIRQRR